MQNFIIRAVEKCDLTLLDSALRALSLELGDEHPASMEFLEQAGFGPTPTYHALIALTTDDNLSGAVVFSPVMSTSLAATGLYVSDLWVSQTARAVGLGRQLLAQAADASHTRWGANYLKLAVYDSSRQARRFYDHLGLEERSGESTLFLNKPRFDALKARA
ncbi:MAG: GNAT family N-acetyltransferase [Granulosicoccus sp.]